MDKTIIDLNSGVTLKQFSITMKHVNCLQKQFQVSSKNDFLVETASLG